MVQDSPTSDRQSRSAHFPIQKLHSHTNNRVLPLLVQVRVLQIAHDAGNLFLERSEALRLSQHARVCILNSKARKRGPDALQYEPDVVPVGSLSIARVREVGLDAQARADPRAQMLEFPAVEPGKLRNDVSEELGSNGLTHDQSYAAPLAIKGASRPRAIYAFITRED